MGGSHSFSGSNTSAEQQQNVYGPQGAALSNLWGAAQKLFEGQDLSAINKLAGNISGQMANYAQMANPAYQNQLGGGFQNAALNGMYENFLSSPTATQRWQQGATGGNSFTQPLIDSATNALQQNYEQNARPQTEAGAMMAGQSGSSRHGVSDAIQQRELGQDKAAVTNQIGQQNYWNQLGLEKEIAQGLDANKLQALQQWQGVTDAQNRNQQWGMGAGQGMQGMANNALQPMSYAQQLPWQNLQNYAAAIGAPIVLGSGSSESKGRGHSGGFSMNG